MANQRRARRRVTAPDPNAVDVSGVTEEAPVVEPTEIQEDGSGPKVEEVRPQRAPRGASVEDAPVEVGATELVKAMFEHLAETGDAILVQSGKANTFLVSSVAKPTPKAPTGKGYKEEKFWSEEYKAFKEWWKPMSMEEKEAWATENGVKWSVHTDPLVNNIRLTVSTQKHKGVSKYQLGYETRAARIAGVPVLVK